MNEQTNKQTNKNNPQNTSLQKLKVEEPGRI